MYRKDRKEQVSEYVIPFIGADDGFYQYEIRIKTGALPFAGRRNFEYFFGNIPSKVFLERGFPKICSKFTEEHPCGSMIRNIMEISARVIFV